MFNLTILILLIVFFIILAGFFAGAETGVYQLSRLRLRLGIEKKRLSFIILGKTLKDSSALLLSTLLGTNLAHYLITSIVTYLLLTKLHAEHTSELLAMIITAPVLYVFSELIPKNIFFYRADALMPFISPVLFAFHRLFTLSGIVPLLKFVSAYFAKLASIAAPPKMAVTSVQRHQIAAILKDTHEEGVLSPVQSDIINRLVIISNIRISMAMIPLGKVRTAEQNTDNSALLNILRESAFTRLPVYDRWPENILGFINIYDCLTSNQHFTGLQNFINPIRKLPADTTVSDALNIMKSENQKIALVTQNAQLGRDKPIGIITMKDLVEELLGELSEW